MGIGFANSGVYAERCVLTHGICSVKSLNHLNSQGKLSAVLTAVGLSPLDRDMILTELRKASQTSASAGKDSSKKAIQGRTSKS